jgi:hypothetical protein
MGEESDCAGAGESAIEGFFIRMGVEVGVIRELMNRKAMYI